MRLEAREKQPEWKLIVALASQCEELCELQGRSRAEVLARSGVEIDLLRGALMLGSSLVRRKALHLLSFFDLNTALDDLSAVLASDPSPVVRHEAAYFLGMLKCETALEPLGRALKYDADALVRHEAAEALGDLGSPRALLLLQDARSDPSEVVRETVSMAIEQLSLADVKG